MGERFPMCATLQPRHFLCSFYLNCLRGRPHAGPGLCQFIARQHEHLARGCITASITPFICGWEACDVPARCRFFPALPAGMPGQKPTLSRLNQRPGCSCREYDTRRRPQQQVADFYVSTPKLLLLQTPSARSMKVFATP